MYHLPKIKTDIKRAYELLYALADAVVHKKELKATLQIDTETASALLNGLTQNELRDHHILGVQTVPFYRIIPLGYYNFFIVDDTFAIMLQESIGHKKEQDILFQLHTAADKNKTLAMIDNIPVITKQPEDTWYTLVYKWYEAKRVQGELAIQGIINNV